MTKGTESRTAAEVKKLGEKEVAAEVVRLKVEWDRLTTKFLPIQEQLNDGQASGAEMERLIAERTRLVEELRAIGDRLEELGAVEEVEVPDPQRTSGDLPPEVIVKSKGEKTPRAQLKTAYPELFQQLSDCLFRLDPMGINFESNTDEYEPEVGTILPRLGACTSEEDTLDVVYEEFKRWFGATAGEKATYRTAAAEIWRLWNQRQK